MKTSELPRTIRESYEGSEKEITGASEVDRYTINVYYNGSYDQWKYERGSEEWYKRVEIAEALYVEDSMVQILEFDYRSRKANDDHPKILFLHKYTNDTTGNPIICGINLNYISIEEKIEIYNDLADLFDCYPKDRLNYISTFFPDVVEVAYRHYNEAYMMNIVEQKAALDNLKEIKDNFT